MCQPYLEVHVFEFPVLFYFLKFLDNWENLNMNLSLGNIKELLLMLLDKIMMFGYVRKCPLFLFLKMHTKICRRKMN